MSNTNGGATLPTGSGKAIGAVVGGALYTIIVYLIQAIAHVTLPAEVSAAIQTLVVTACVYFTPHTLGSN